MFHGSLSSAEVILPPGGIFLQCGKSCVFHVFEVEQRTIDRSDSPSFTVWYGFHLCVRYLLPPPPPLPLLFIPDSETDMITQPSDRRHTHKLAQTVQPHTMRLRAALTTSMFAPGKAGVSHHEQLQQQHQQKQQALGRWEFWVVAVPRPPPVPVSAEVSLRPPPMLSSAPRSAGIGPVYCTDTYSG